MGNLIRIFRDGDDGDTVRQAIYDSFNNIGLFIPNDVLCLTKTQRLTMAVEYKTEGKIVFDITDGLWYKYSNGNWVVYNFIKKYIYTFTKDQWVTESDSSYTLAVPKSLYQYLDIDSINLNANILLGGVYEKIELDYNLNIQGDIILKSDIKIDGKVVVY